MDTTNPQQVLDDARAKLTEGGPALDIAPAQFPVDSATIAKDKASREAKSGFTDYLGNMWRQDTFVDGLVAHAAGDSALMPDPNYAPYDAKEWKDLTDGVPQEYHSVFYRAHSAAHARYLKDLIGQKVTDQTNLGDLGVPGNIARVAFGFVEPTTLAAGLISGGSTAVIKGVMTVRAATRAVAVAKAIEEPMARAAALATATEHLAAAAASEGTRGAIAGGLATAGGAGAGFEAIRQHYSFEDNPSAVLEAGLITMAFATPFVGINARSMRRLTQTAGEDRQALHAAREVMSGNPPTAEQTAALDRASVRLKEVYDLETGKVDAVEHDFHVQARDREMSFRAATAQLDAKKEAELNQLWADGHIAKAEDAVSAAHIEAANMGNRTQLSDAFAAARERKLATEARKAELAKPKGEAPVVEKPLVEQTIADVAKVEPADPKAQSAELMKQRSALYTKGGSRPPRGTEKGKLYDDLTARARALEPAPVEAPKPPITDPTDHLGKVVTWGADQEHAGIVVDKNASGALRVDLYPTLRKGEKPPHGDRYEWKYPEELHPESPLHRAPEPAAGFLPNSVGAAQTVPTKNVWDDRTAMAKGRFDIFQRLNASANSVIRKLAFELVKDAIQISKHYAQGWTASEIKKNMQRTLGGHFHSVAADAFQEAMKVRKIGFIKSFKEHQSFYENIARVVRGDQEVLRANPDIAPMLQKAASAMDKVYAETLARAQKAGVAGALNVQSGGQYVNRVWHHNNIRTAMKAHGDDSVVKLIAGSIRAAGVTDPMKTAGKFLDAVKKLEYSHALNDLPLVGRDMLALRKELDHAGLTAGEIDSIVDVMFAQHKTGKVDAAAPANLKFRFDLDENYREHQADGSYLQLSDLFENDSRLLMDKYLNSMAGHIGLAEKGIHSREEFMARLKAAEDEHAASGYAAGDATKFNEERQMIADMYDNITGRPMSMQPFNKADRYLGAFRAYVRSTMLGQLGIAAASEMINVVGLSTGRAFWQQMPAFRQAITAARSGQRISKSLGSDIEAWVGFGLEQSAAYSRQHEITDFTHNTGALKAENLANKASHAVDVMSGNSWLTSATRKFAAMIAVQDHHNLASGKTKLTPKIRERLVGQGIDDDAIDGVLAGLKEHTTTDTKGRVDTIDWEGWQRADQKSYDAYTLAVTRQVRDGIQEHDIGETWIQSHTLVGKIFGELRTFSMASHSKQSLKNLYYHDERAANTFMFTFAGQALAYVAQTSANFAQNPAELDKRLTIDRISKAVIQRMSIMGLTPMIFESAYYVGSGGHSFFQGGTTNTDNRNLFVTPSMMAAGRLMTGTSMVGSAVNPFSDSTVTKKEASDAFSALPGGNWFLMRNINDAVSSQFPKKEPKQ